MILSNKIIIITRVKNNRDFHSNLTLNFIERKSYYMIYKLKIAANNIELVRLITSPEDKKISEIKIASSELGFRFNRNLIFSNLFFDEFVEKVSTIIEPFLADITELKISLRHNFFNIHKLPLDNLSRLDYDTTYLNWELNQYITNESEKYLYGYTHNTNERKTVIIILRTKIKDYFDKVFTSINGSIERWSLGYDFLNEGETNFVSTKRKIITIYDKEKQSIIKKTSDKIKRFKITNVVKLLATVFLFVFIILSFFNKAFVTDKIFSIFNGESENSEYLASSSSKDITTPLAENNIDSLKVEKDKSNDTTLKNDVKIENKDLKVKDSKNKNIFYNFLYKVLISESDINFVIVSKENVLLRINNAKKAAEYKKEFKSSKLFNKSLEIIGSSKDILKLSLKSYNNSSNLSDITKSKKYLASVKDKLNIKGKQPAIVVSNKSDLLTLLDELFNEKFYFSKIKVSVRNDKFYFVVDFD